MTASRSHRADVKCTFDLLTNQAKDKLRLNFRQTWWVNCRQHDHQWRPRGDISSENGRSRAYWRCSPRATPRSIPAMSRRAQDAAAPDRHRARSNFVRVQAAPGHQARAQPGLLETGAALSRRHRVHDHPEPLEPRSSGFIAGKFDMTFPYEVTIPAVEGYQEPSAAGDVPGGSGHRVDRVLVNRTAPPFDNAELRAAR